MPQFKIQQIALCPKNPTAAIELLTAMGLKDWAHDHVVALGYVDVCPHEVNDLRRDTSKPVRNEADLAFNYEGFDEKRELEVLHYTAGENWLAGGEPRVSHLGMHCTAAELAEWRKFFDERGIVVAQEVLTWTHTNPVIAGKRWYNYVIFNTYEILGVDIKFIVRREQP